MYRVTTQNRPIKRRHFVEKIIYWLVSCLRDPSLNVIFLLFIFSSDRTIDNVLSLYRWSVLRNVTKGNVSKLNTVIAVQVISDI